MSDFKASKDAAQYLMSNLACSICEDLPGSIGDRKNRYACSNGHIVCEKCILDKCSCESETFSGPLSLLEKMIEESTCRDGQKPEFFENPGFGFDPGFKMKNPGFSG